MGDPQHCVEPLLVTTSVAAFLLHAKDSMKGISMPWLSWLARHYTGARRGITMKAGMAKFLIACVKAGADKASSR